MSPLYDYYCSDCKKSVEVFLKLKDLEDKIDCLECGALMDKEINVVHFTPVDWGQNG